MSIGMVFRGVYNSIIVRLFLDSSAPFPMTVIALESLPPGC
jgi:hypothetical protein